MQISRFVRILWSLFFIFAVDSKLAQVQDIDQSNERCPNGYFLQSNELCYPKINKPYPFETQSISTAVATTNAFTVHSTRNIIKLDCPEGSILIKNKCRKIICSLGEFYSGTCLQAVCPQGLVWRGRKCQKPGYVITIIEIDNVLISEVNKNPLSLSGLNEVVYHTSATRNPFNTSQSFPLLRPTQGTKYSTSSTTSNGFKTIQNNGVCCKVFTPRICKLYGNKWLCFNRKYQRCDSRICKSPIVYLKPPEIKYEPPILIMPPNPQLNACVSDNCYNSSIAVDCSGCANFRSENCSSHCYRYICPNNTCTFIDLSEYCNIYTGQGGCLATDGCLWEWCQI